VLHTNMAMTSLTLVGHSAGFPEPILRPSPATGHDAEILDVYDPYLGYDAETFPYQQPQRKMRSTSRAALLGGVCGHMSTTPLLGYKCHRSGKEVRQQQWSLAQERWHFLYPRTQGRRTMKRVCTLTIGTLGVLFLGMVLSVGEVFAQTAKDLAGTWTLVSAVTEQGGNKTDTFGPHPKGILTVDANGRYVLAIVRAGLPKVASNNRTTATPEENKAIVEGSITHFGTLSVNAADKAFTFKVETATFPNWDGTEQKRPFIVTGDELQYTVAAASGGGTATVVWKRAK
jgi:Lipocalin-like domain